MAHVTKFERQIALSGATEVEKALKAISKPKGRQGSRPFKGYYNNCGRFGHKQSECLESDQSEDSSDSGSDSGPGGAESTDNPGQETPSRKPAKPVEQAGLALAS